MALLRRKLHNHILKNQYSFWAGMYVKRLPGESTGYGTGGRPNADEVLQANKASALTVERMIGQG